VDEIVEVSFHREKYRGPREWRALSTHVDNHCQQYRTQFKREGELGENRPGTPACHKRNGVKEARFGNGIESRRERKDEVSQGKTGNQHRKG